MEEEAMGRLGEGMDVRRGLLRSASEAVAALVAAAGCASILDAQAPPPAPPDQEIVVEVREREAVRNFVAAMTDPDISRQIARWTVDICPTVIGIEPGQADFMAGRIGELATSINLRAGRGDCLTTMLVVVSNNARELAQALAREYPITLRSDRRSTLDRFVASTRPVRWISVVSPCGVGVAPGDTGGCALTGSRLTLATHPEFQAILVIVDAHQIAGYQLGELSDYVALVALANPPINGSRPSRSILSMFDRDRSEQASFSLTDYDRAFLAGVYRSRGNGSGQEQRSAIRRNMREEGRRSPNP